mgnify:CR=1 FL=1
MARAGAAANTELMSVPGDRRRSLRDRVFGVAGAVVAAGVLASCGTVVPGGALPATSGTVVPGGAVPAASGACPQAGGPAPGQQGSLIVSGGLDGVAAASAGSAWAVGSTIMTDPLTMRWNGGEWAEQVLTLVPGRPGNPPGGFGAVAAVSAGDVWAVGGTAGRPLAEHWNGNEWTVVPTPSPGPQDSGDSAGLDGVAVMSARNIWAVGTTNFDKTWIIHWDGTAWTRVPSPNPPGENMQLNGVAAASATSAWAVGSYTNPVTDAWLPLIEHWDGHAWTLVPSPAVPDMTTPVLTGVAAVSPDSAWSVGAGGLIEHWDGKTWTKVHSPDVGTLHAVAALSPDNAWAVGVGSLCPGAFTKTLIEHWDGRAWTVVPSPADGILNAVTAVSPDDAWAVGSVSLSDSSPAVIEHWDGKTWTWPPGFCGSPSGPGCLPTASPTSPQ